MIPDYSLKDPLFELVFSYTISEDQKKNYFDEKELGTLKGNQNQFFLKDKTEGGIKRKKCNLSNLCGLITVVSNNILEAAILPLALIKSIPLRFRAKVMDCVDKIKHLSSVRIFKNSVSECEQAPKNIDQAIITRSSKILKFISDLKSSPQPSDSFLPFEIIQYLTSYHLEAFMKATVKSMTSANLKHKEGIKLTTSCLNTLYALSIILFGEEYLNKSYPLDLVISTPLDVDFSTKSIKDYTVFNIIPGHFIQDLNCIHAAYTRLKGPLTEAEKNKQLHDYLLAQDDLFIAAINDIIESRSYINEENFEDYLESIIEEIVTHSNQVAVCSLKEEIQNNQRKVNLDTAIVYSLGILGSSSTLKETFFDHTFQLIQFFNDKTQKVEIKRLQSWIRQATLGEDMRSNEAWNDEQLEVFLTNLTRICCQNLSLEETYVYQDCFGYEVNYESPLVTTKDDHISTKNLRYFSQAIHPSQCLDNVESFIRAHANLINE